MRNKYVLRIILSFASSSDARRVLGHESMRSRTLHARWIAGFAIFTLAFLQPSGDNNLSLVTA